MAPDAMKHPLIQSISRITGIEWRIEQVHSSTHAGVIESDQANVTSSNSTCVSGNATSNITDGEINQSMIEEDFSNAWSEALAERTPIQVAAHALNVISSLALHSETTLLLLIQWSFSAQLVIALITVKIFLGRLSQREFSRLTERSVRFAIFKLVFAGVLIPQLVTDSSEIVFWFSWLAFTSYLRVFIGGAKDRLDFIAALPRASWISQARPLALTGLLVILANFSIFCLWNSDAFNMQKFLLCFFDLFCVHVEATRTLVRYSVHLYEQRALESSPLGDSDSRQAPVWEGKGSFLFYLDLISDLVLQTCGLFHYFQIWSLRGLRPHVVDLVLFMDVRSILLLIAKKIQGLLAYRRITHELNFAFPTKSFSHSQLATTSSPEQEGGQAQEEDQTCAICMEEMRIAKRLPCQHCFHLSCLRAMLQQSGPHAFVCPLCRTPLLQQRALDRHQRRRTRGNVQDQSIWLSSLTHFVQSIYLDVAVQIFFGFPVDLETLRLRHAMNQERRLQRLLAPGTIGGIATALAGGVVRVEPHGLPRRGGRTRRLRLGDTEEEVGESEAPPRLTGGEEEPLDPLVSPQVQNGLELAEGETGRQGPVTRGAGVRGSLRRRVRRSVAGEATQDEEGPASEPPLEPLDEAGPSSLDARREGEEELRLPLRPPPYDDEEEDSRSIWSVNVSHQVVRSIRSSIAVGARGGPAAIAGQLHLSNDQEAESPRVQ